MARHFRAGPGHVGRVLTVGTEGLPIAPAVQRYFIVLRAFVAIDHGHELAVVSLTARGDISHVTAVGTDHRLADLVVLRPAHTIDDHRLAGLGLDDADVGHVAGAGPIEQGAEAELIILGCVRAIFLATPLHRAP